MSIDTGQEADQKVLDYVIIYSEEDLNKVEGFHKALEEEVGLHGCLYDDVAYLSSRKLTNYEDVISSAVLKFILVSNNLGYDAEDNNFILRNSNTLEEALTNRDACVVPIYLTKKHDLSREAARNLSHITLKIGLDANRRDFIQQITKLTRMRFFQQRKEELCSNIQNKTKAPEPTVRNIVNIYRNGEGPALQTDGRCGDVIVNNTTIHPDGIQTRGRGKRICFNAPAAFWDGFAAAPVDEYSIDSGSSSNDDSDIRRHVYAQESCTDGSTTQSSMLVV